MKKNLLTLLLILTLALSLAGCGKKASQEATGPEDTKEEATEDLTDLQAEFAAFVEEQYLTSVEDSYTTVHTYYLDPEAAGIDMDNVEIGFGLAPTSDDMEEDRVYYKSLKTALSGFDRESLTRRQQDEYDSLEWEIDSVLALCDEKFDYYDQYFASPNSLDANIVGLFSTWDLRNGTDVKNFISLVNSIPTYVDSAIEYARKQQEMELFMTDFDQVIEGCDDVLEVGMDSFVVNRLMNQIDSLEDLSNDEKTAYKEELSEAFEKSYLPAFTTIKEAMEDMKGGYNNTGSLYDFKDGAEYFQARLNYTLGTYGVSCDDILEEAKRSTEKHLTDLAALYQSNAKAVDSFYNNPQKTGYSGYEEILEDVSKKMLQDYPEVKNLDYNIEKADPEEKLDDKNIAAYFVVPPVDGSHRQEMRVNPSNEEMDTIDTYITVTHEGFPGHMYQYAYMADNISSDYIKTLEVDSMVEGYAVYSQYEALNYLDLPEATKALSALNEQLAYVDYGYVDIGIHFKGWGPEEILKHFNDGGYNLTLDIATEIYEFLRFTPTYYEPYGIGYEYYASLRDSAEEALGEKFSAKDFNKAILDAGSTPRSVVSRYVEEYVESAK